MRYFAIAFPSLNRLSLRIHLEEGRMTTALGITKADRREIMALKVRQTTSPDK
jgi:hypothetical protein